MSDARSWYAHVARYNFIHARRLNHQLTMETWKKYISDGNSSLIKCDFEAARQSYEKARVEAESKFVSLSEPVDAVFAVIVTYHNLADLYQKQGYTKMARLALETVHDHLLRSVVSNPLSSARHAALYRGSVLTYSKLMAHKRCHIVEGSSIQTDVDV